MANLVFISGKKHSGKTTLAKSIQRYQLATHPRDGRDIRFVVLARTPEWVARPGVEVLPANRYSCEQAARYAIKRAPSVFMCDEIDLFCPNHAGGLKSGTATHAIVHYGRHEEVAAIFAARRPANVHTDIRSLADTIYFFAHREPLDLEWIERRCGEDMKRRVAELPVCRRCVFNEDTEHSHPFIRFDD